MLRKTIFWLHLIVGLAAGLVVLIMSVTGVMLTYELQVLAWAEPRVSAPSMPEVQPLPIADLLTAVSATREGHPTPSGISFANDPAAPAKISFGRRDQVNVNPYTGEVLIEGESATRDFFRWAMGWHRWLGLEGEGRDWGRAITGACNLGFLFLVVSGFYLWWPRHLRWSAFRPVLWFRRGLGGKARDWNWHNVIGFWTALPLLFVVLSGVVISYPWASDLLGQLTGAEPRASGGGSSHGPERRGGRAEVGSVESFEADDALAGADAALASVRAAAGDWQTISVRVPDSSQGPLDFTVDRGTGRQPQERTTLSVDRATGEILSTSTFGDQPLHQQARSIVRFGHTGEIGGVIGQTIAGLASAGAVVLVWTGFALAFRRLILKPLRHSRPDTDTSV